MDPQSQELQLQRAGVPRDNIHRDVGISGTTGTQGRQGWHQLDVRLAGGDTLALVAMTASEGPGKAPYGPSVNCVTGA